MKNEPVEKKLETKVREWCSAETLEQRGFFVWGQGKDGYEVFVERLACLLDGERAKELDENVTTLSPSTFGFSEHLAILSIMMICFYGRVAFDDAYDSGIGDTDISTPPGQQNPNPSRTSSPSSHSIPPSNPPPPSKSSPSPSLQPHPHRKPTPRVLPTS